MSFDNQGRFIPQQQMAQNNLQQIQPMGQAQPSINHVQPISNSDVSGQFGTIQGAPMQAPTQVPKINPPQFDLQPPMSSPQQNNYATPPSATPPQQLIPQPKQQPQNPNQSVQNTLHSMQGQGFQNRQMNAPGQQGQQAQAGFQGFGQNGSYGPQYINPGNMGPMQSQLGFQSNQSQFGSYQNSGQGTNGNVQQSPYYTNTTPFNKNTQFADANPNQPGNTATPYQSAQLWNSQLNLGRPIWGGLIGGPTSNPYQSIGSNAGMFGYQDLNLAQGPPPQNASNVQPLPVNNQIVPSDINSKQHILPAEGELQEFLNSLGIYSYEYKNKEYGEGRRISPMAQEIEKTDLGKVAISTNKEGYKQVDYGKLAGTQLAALALVNHKLNILENQLKANISEGLKRRKNATK